MLLANFNRKEHLRHRAVSLRQHGFLVWCCDLCLYCGNFRKATIVNQVVEMRTGPSTARQSNRSGRSITQEAALASVIACCCQRSRFTNCYLETFCVIITWYFCISRTIKSRGERQVFRSSISSTMDGSWYRVQVAIPTAVVPTKQGRRANKSCRGGDQPLPFPSPTFPSLWNIILLHCTQPVLDTGRTRTYSWECMCPSSHLGHWSY